MTKKIRIFLADDHQVVRDGLRSMLGEETDMEVVGQSGNGSEVLRQVETLSPNILLMDIKMPQMDGIQLTRLVKQRCPFCQVIMLTLYDQYLSQAIEAGARGYLLKDISRGELIRAIRQVHGGELVFSQSITDEFAVAAGPLDGRRVEEALSPVPVDAATMLEEVQLVIPPPPVDAGQLMRFTSQLEKMLAPRVLQVIGSWREGTAINTVLPAAMSLGDILLRLREMPEIDTVKEELPKQGASPVLLKKAAAIPKPKTRPSKTIFVNLKTHQPHGDPQAAPSPLRTSGGLRDLRQSGLEFPATAPPHYGVSLD